MICGMAAALGGGRCGLRRVRPIDIRQTEAPGLRGEEVGADIAEGPRLLEGPRTLPAQREPRPSAIGTCARRSCCAEG